MGSGVPGGNGVFLGTFHTRHFIFGGLPKNTPFPPVSPVGSPPAEKSNALVRMRPLMLLLYVISSVATNTSTSSVTRTHLGTPTVTATRSRLFSPTDTATRSRLFSPTGTATRSRLFSPTPTTTHTATGRGTVTGTATRTHTPTVTDTASGTLTPTHSKGVSGTSTGSSSPTSNPSATPVPTVSPSANPIPSPSSQIGSAVNGVSQSPPNDNTILGVAIGGILGIALVMAGIALYVIKQQKPRKPLHYVPTIMNTNPLDNINPLRI